MANDTHPNNSAPQSTVALKANAIPAVYVMTQYISGSIDNRSVSKLTPLTNTLVFAANPTQAQYDAKRPLLLRTNEHGALYTLRDSDNSARQLFHAHVHQQRTILLPPPDVLGFFKAAKNASNSNWKAELISELAEVTPAQSMLELTLEAHPFSHLRKPLDRPSSDNNDTVGNEGEPNHTDSEAAYRQWYQRQNPNQPILAYVLAKTRALVVVANQNLPIKWDVRLSVTKPNGEHELLTWLRDPFGDYRMAVFTGNQYSLPKGIYRASAILQSERIEPRQWHAPLSQTGDSGEYRYQIAELARFDITHAAGEIEVMSINPITLEESLINQFPRFYSHLLGVVTDMSKRTDKLSTTSASAISDKVAQSSPGFVDYATNWSVLKSKSELAAKLGSVDLGRYQKEDGGHYNGQQKLSFEIAKALHGHLETEENDKVKASLNAVFAVESGVAAWKEFKDKRASYIKAVNSSEGLASGMSAVRQHYFGVPNHSADDVAKFQRSIAGKIGVPQMAVDVFGKAMTVVDLATSVAAVPQSGYAYFKTTLPNRDEALKNYAIIAKDYFTKFSEKDFVDVLRLVSNFEFKKAFVSEAAKRDILRITRGVISALENDDSLVVMVAGHTCDMGGYEYNMALSQSRADAVKAVLVDAGIDSNRIDTSGHSFDMPVDILVANSTKEARQQNRRVEIITNVMKEHDLAPSREGMGTLERYRNLTVQRQLGVQDEQLKIAGQVTDLALGIMAVIPVTAPFAAAVALVKAGSGALVSVGEALDTLVNDGAIKQYFTDQKHVKTMGRESNANQGMIYDLCQAHGNTDDLPNHVLWAAQYRVRAEAIAGLVDLLMRAALDSPEEPYTSRIAKYSIDAYIENFILGSDWLYPIEGAATLRMSSYWLFAINQFDADEQRDTKALKTLNTGLGSDNTFVSLSDREAIKRKSAELLLEQQNNYPTGAGPYSMYMMQQSRQRRVAKHISSQFQQYFPVHQFSALDNSDKLTQFAETFRPVFRDQSPCSYLHTRVYYKDTRDSNPDKPWLPFISESQSGLSTEDKPEHFDIARITPYTPIRVLVVFKENAPAILPLSFGINRIDGYDVQGPVYKELGRSLTSSELLDHEQGFEGHVGCVFYPFYQVWDKTHLGLKPIVGEWRMPFGVDAYYAMGMMDKMKYQITCQVGDDTTSNVVIPLKSQLDDSQNIIYHKGSGFRTEVADTITLDIQEERQGELLLLNQDFLVSRTKEFDYPRLYEGAGYLHVAMKLGDNLPFVMFERDDTGDEQRFYDGRNTDIFSDEISQVSANLNVDIVSGKKNIKVKGFDWTTRVGFACTYSCEGINDEDYKDKAIDWRSIPFSMKLYERELFGNSEGPTLNAKMVYLGELTAKGKTFTVYNDERVNYEASTGVAKNSPLSPLISLLKKVNTSTITDTEQMQLAAFFGDFGHEERYITRTRHVFAAYFQCAYESPKGVAIDGIRPFGKGVLDASIFGRKNDFDDYVNIMFGDFASAGLTGINESTLASKFEAFRYSLSTPDSMTRNVPWSQPLEKDDVMEGLKERMIEGEYDKLFVEGLSEEDLEKWMIDDAKSLKHSFLSIFKP